MKATTIDLMKRDDDQLAWTWAVSNALRLFDEHDAYWINRIEDGSFDEDDWKRLWEAYRIKQGFGPKFLRVTWKTSWPMLRKICEQPLGMSAKEIYDRWSTATRGLQSEMSSADKTRTKPMLWSAMSKLLWFFHPHHMTMYDSQAHKALKHISKESNAGRNRCITKENFINDFTYFFDENSTTIKSVIKGFDRQYPYERRVLDQYLWLAGSGKKEDILKKFRAGLEHLPHAKGSN